MNFTSLAELNEAAVKCTLCPRLRKYCQRIAREKRRQFRDCTYYGKPLPGFGDPKARLLILGLAPAAHGGNRTGRMFTGDGSASFLMRALYRFDFANQPLSEKVDDGLVLRDAYMTAIVRCAPPKNKPTRREIDTCRRYWTSELKLLPNLRVVLALGKIAFDAYARFLRTQQIDTSSFRFGHALCFELPPPYPVLCASYHPSRQNTQTGRLTPDMFDEVFTEIRAHLASE